MISSGTGNVTVSGGNGINGNVTNSGSGTLTVSLNSSSLTGDITIYGADIGTDHKFTLSTDSDLDYRIPGTNGEFNSYYGGLYATWLHSSGCYIDVAKI
ncbi:MAG: autotransporter outer membrane beta-barrel domain-containing protein [Verrucomicrobiales bacterium]|jgi:hypothetical protein|nr:autotransporter outer membrane beta-barrel domain-containing protein [Verrucomicrobiales bacterium]